MDSKQNSEYCYNIASDYISGAYSYMHAASIVIKQTKRGELDDPISFLLGHSCELVLKAGLAINNYDDSELSNFGHDLKKLMSLNISRGVEISADLKMWIDMIADNYFQHDYKYSRVFAGFPDQRYAELSNLVSKKRTPKEDRILKGYGLMVKSVLTDYERFVNSLEQHIDCLFEAMESQRGGL